MSGQYVTGSAAGIHYLLFGPPRTQAERDRAEIRGCLRRFRQLRAIAAAYHPHVPRALDDARAARLRVRALVRRIRLAEGGA